MRNRSNGNPRWPPQWRVSAGGLFVPAGLCVSMYFANVLEGVGRGTGHRGATVEARSAQHTHACVCPRVCVRACLCVRVCVRWPPQGAQLWKHDQLDPEPLPEDSDLWKGVSADPPDPPLDRSTLEMLRAEIRALLPGIHQVPPHARTLSAPPLPHLALFKGILRLTCPTQRPGSMARGQAEDPGKPYRPDTDRAADATA